MMFQERNGNSIRGTELKSILSFAKQNKYIRKIIIPVIACIAIAGFLEITLFNFRFYQSRRYEPILGVPYTVSNNLEMRDYNTYEVVSLDEKPYVDLVVKGVDIKNVYVDVWPKAEVWNADRLRMHFWVVDQDDVLGYELPVLDYTRGVWQTMYTAIDLSGDCDAFRVYFDDGLSEGQLLRIDNIGFNVRVPFSLSKKRVLAVAIILMLLFFLRPSSGVYGIKALDKFKGKRVIIAAFILVQVLIIHSICGLNGACREQNSPTEHQFDMMAEALVNGQPYLLEEPPKLLSEMENPYSFQARLENGTQDESMYDVAYYKGHYYVYFGVGPIITFYVPYYLVTGKHIETYNMVFIIGVMVAVGWMMLLYELIRKYFRNFSFAAYLVCSFLFTASCGLTYVASRPSFYAIPMTLGLVASLFGLSFWFRSIEDDENGVNRINPIYVCIGSFFMAYVASCRPQFLLGSFFAILIFWNAVFKDRKLFSKESISATACFILPYILIAAGLMYYNYIRFESVFDFGANYNLTFNDMNYRGFRLNRLLYATIGFMFLPAKVTNSFPYFKLGEYVTKYQGYTTDERLLGGLFYNNAYLLAIAFIPKCKKFFKDNTEFILAIIAPIFAVVIMVVDANMAGVLNRYLVDFSWLVIISFFLLFGHMITNMELEVYRKVIAWTFYGLAILSLIHMFFMIFGGDINGLENNNIMAFQRVMHMIEFWN